MRGHGEPLMPSNAPLDGTGPSLPSGPGRFDRVLGAGRGLVDAQALNDRLRAAERDVVTSLRRIVELEAAVLSLEHDATMLRVANDSLEHELREAEEDQRCLLFERDLVRYALVRGGQLDPVHSAPPTHQGTFRPGRPYLREHHVRDAKNNYCYHTDGEGVPAGCAPGRGRRWVRCENDADCPSDPALLSHPAFGSHP